MVLAVVVVAPETIPSASPDSTISVPAGLTLGIPETRIYQFIFPEFLM